MSKIRLGIIGCGNMAGAHLQGFNYLDDICEVTAICDIVPQRAEQTAQFLKADFFTTDYKEMVDYVDAVLVILPHHLHFECGMFFIEHNIHVLMEKPLCNTEEECLTLVEAAEARNLTLMCAYPVPYWEGVLKLKELLDSGEYGEIFQLSIWTEQYTHNPDKSWGHSAKTLGGGQLFSHGCHYIDLMLRFLGEPVSGFHMGSRKGTPWMEMEGNSNVTMTFANGAMGYHFGTWGARGSSHKYNIQVHTDKGLFEYRHYDRQLIFITSDVKPGNVDNWSTEYKTVWNLANQGKQTQHETRHFIECIQQNKKPLTDGRSSIQSLRVIWRLYEAEQNNVIADLRGLGV